MSQVPPAVRPGPAFLLRLDEAGEGPRLAVKDCIDVAGHPTTAGSAVVAATARPAARDASCVAAARAAGARLVGKTNLHELCFGGTGVNPWFGTPVNPRDPALVPGGSSSGSGVAVATGEADVALGTDTAGSVRNPAACCGVVGLKTTWGRIPVDGVWPLAPSLDTVGVLAPHVAGVELGMALLEPGFARARREPGRVLRLRAPLEADPVVDEAIDRALSAAGLPTADVDLPSWAAAHDAGVVVLLAEALAANRALVTGHLAALGPDLQARFRAALELTPADIARAEATGAAWRSELDDLLAGATVLAAPTLLRRPARLDEVVAGPNPAALAVNLGGHPAVAVPVPLPGHVPASLQLVAARGAEADLLALAAVVEGAVEAVVGPAR